MIAFAIAHNLLSNINSAQAQFFATGETYANQVFPTAQPITTIVVGTIRLIFIYLIGSRALGIISGGRGDDKVSDLAREIVILLLAILAVDALLELIIP